MSTPDPVPTISTINTPTPDGKWNVKTVTTSLITTTVSFQALAPIIPVGAGNSGFLDASTKWKSEKDPGTPGTATATTKYIDASSGRNFNVVQKNKAGWRFSNSFGNSLKARNVCYDLYVKADVWSEVGELELDMNIVLPNGNTCILGIQANFVKGLWQYTTMPGGKSHWNDSNIPTVNSSWQNNVWRHLRLFSSCDDNGNATYNGVETDGIYTPFADACKGPSSAALGWTPIGVLLNNFQLDGSTVAGTMNVFGKQIQISYW